MIGALYVGNDRVKELFRKPQLDLLTIFASQASLILQNAMLLAALRAQTAQTLSRTLGVGGYDAYMKGHGRQFTNSLSVPVTRARANPSGAEVIKVEVPEAGDDTRHIAPHQGDVSFYHSTVNRSKASVEVDLKSSEGRKLIHAMAADCDVLIQNFRPGVLEAWGIGPDELQAINPGLVILPIHRLIAAAADCDYIIADRIVIPKESERWYRERVVALPDSYQCNDRKRARPDHAPSRRDAGGLRCPGVSWPPCCRPAVPSFW